MAFEVTVTGEETITRQVAALRARGLAAAERAVRGYVRGPGMRRVEAATPVDTGRMRRSWEMTEPVPGRRFVLRNRAPYSRRVFGHPRYRGRLPRCALDIARGAARAIETAIKQELGSMRG